MPIIVVKFYFMRVEKRRKKKTFVRIFFFFFNLHLQLTRQHLVSSLPPHSTTSFQSQKPDADSVTKAADLPPASIEPKFLKI
jgi:hypothetical protein